LTVHVLTKIFIVLVSLLAVFLVPLVVVYAHNEDNYRARYQSTEAQIQVKDLELQAEVARHRAEVTRLRNEIDELQGFRRSCEGDRNAALDQVRVLESRVAQAEALRGETQAELAKLASGVQASTTISDSLLGELRTIRRDLMAAERQRVDLDDALRERTAELEVAVAARRALQEELHRITEEQAKTMSRLSEYIARHGTLTESPVALGIIPDRSVTTSVLAVRRSADQVLVEIGAGSRDGLREGWTMVIGRGAEFLGNLRIISVDLNRATGVVTLENPARGLVDIGDVVQSFAGMD
jgi:hypothetical protein